MALREALSQAVAGRAEAVHDGFDRMVADRVLTPEEIAGYRGQLDELVSEASRADLARALAANVGRCGPTGEYFCDLMRAWQEFAARMQDAEVETVAVIVALEQRPHQAA